MLVKESAFKDASCRAPSRVTTRYLPFKLSEIIHIVFAQNFKLAIFDVHIYAVIVTSCVVKRGFRRFSRWDPLRLLRTPNRATKQLLTKQYLTSCWFNNKQQKASTLVVPGALTKTPLGMLQHSPNPVVVLN